MRLNGSLQRRQRGQSMAEFIVVVPVLTLMLYSVLYFGQAVVYKGRVAMAARYYTLKTARGFDVTDMYGKFFADVGPNNLGYSAGTFPWMNAIGIASYLVPFFDQDQAYAIPGLMTNWNLYDFATEGEVEYRYQPPAYLSFLGSHKNRAGLMVDGNPWSWPTLNLTLTMEFFLALYAWGNDWEPWALPMPWMLGFPRWWALTPWFPFPPYPRYEF